MRKWILDFSKPMSKTLQVPMIEEKYFLFGKGVKLTGKKLLAQETFLGKAEDDLTGYDYLQLSLYSKYPSHAPIIFQVHTGDIEKERDKCYFYIFNLSWSGHKIVTFPLFKGIITGGNPDKGLNHVTGYSFRLLQDCLPPTETELCIDGAWVTNTPVPDSKERFLEMDFTKDYFVEGRKEQKFDAISLLKQKHPNQSHPRLMATKQDFENLKANVKKLPFAQKAYQSILEQAENALKIPVSKYCLCDGRRLDRVPLLIVPALLIAYIVSGEQSFKSRLWAEVEAVCRFPDWNPSHDIDVGDMARPVAFAYDWLYEEWTEEQRRIMRNAMLKSGLEAMVSPLRFKKNYAINHTNHNTVTSSGLGLLALAIGDEVGCEDIANEVINGTVEAIFLNLRTFSPYGVCTEGPGYWNYGMKNFYIYQSSLIKSLGTDFDMKETPGLNTTGDYLISMSGNTGKCFNYADTAIEEDTIVSSLLWIAQLYNRYDYAQFYLEQKKENFDYSDLIYFQEKMLSKDYLATAKNDYFLGNVGNLRGSNIDKNSLYVGFKGGKRDCHMDLDFGSFVFESQGERWFVDFGKENYDMPGMWDYYKNAGRWNYYGKRAEGHNTLVINPKYTSEMFADQNPYAKCDIISSHIQEDFVSCTVDLTSAYENAQKITREFILKDNRKVFCLRDKILLNERSNIYSFFHTQAEIVLLNTHTAKLSQEGKSILFSVESDCEIDMRIMQPESLLEEIKKHSHKDKSGYQKLVIYAKNIQNCTINITVTNATKE